jgi:hypothetical protein
VASKTPSPRAERDPHVVPVEPTEPQDQTDSVGDRRPPPDSQEDRWRDKKDKAEPEPDAEEPDAGVANA